MIVAQLYKCSLKVIEFYFLKWVSFMVKKLYLNEAVV
jgi:hypothetical protein